MSRMLTVLLTLLAVPTGARAQGDWQQTVRQDLVSLRDGKWVIEEFSVESIAIPGYQPVEYQLRLYAEVPANTVVSRDFFVRTTFEVQAAMLLSVIAEAYQTTPAQFLEGLESKPLQAAIGTPDVELSLFMTAEGLQIEWKDNTNGQVSRNTMRWAEVVGR